MGDFETVLKDVCDERHKSLDREIVELKNNVCDVRSKQEEYNQTIKNIYYTLLVIAGATILTLGGVILGRAVDFHIPLTLLISPLL
jgi:hypothetical protein